MRFFTSIFLLGVLYTVIPTAAVYALTVSPVKIEVAGDPGAVVVSEIEIFNEESESKTFYTSSENFEAQGESGAPYFTGDTTGLATWIDVTEKVTVEPGERKVVPFSITIPDTAESGGHFAAIFWGTAPTQTAEGGEVSIGGKIGVLILLSVSGDIAEAGGLVDFTVDDGSYFVDSLPTTFAYRFSNDGGERIRPVGVITIKNVFGATSTVLNANRKDGNILPGSIRKFEVPWVSLRQQKDEVVSSVATTERKFFETVVRQLKMFPSFGVYTAELTLLYGNDSQEANDRIRFVIFPWQLLSIVLVCISIVGILGRILIKRYNRWIIQKAIENRHEGN